LRGRDHSIDVLIDWERQVQDYPPSPAHLRNNRDWRDLQVIRSEAFDILPEHHLAKTGLDLVCDVFLKEGDGRRC
jgi:hypothetical protein